MSAKRFKRVVGDIVKIDLGQYGHSYAQLSSDPLVVFFDHLATKDLLPSEIVGLPIAFKLWVSNADIKKGVWTKIGHNDIANELLIQPFMFKQDRITGSLALHHRSFAETNYEKRALLSQCQGLERAAVWDAAHVQDRLRDHFLGRENKWVKSLEIDVSRVPENQRK